MDPTGWIKFFAEFPGATAAVALAAFAFYLFRENQKLHASNLQTALSVLPIAQKLAEGVEALDRMDRRKSRDD